MHNPYQDSDIASIQRRFFSMFLAGTTGELELRQMTFDTARGKYKPSESIVSRDIETLLSFSTNGGGDVFMGVNSRVPGIINATKEQILEIVCIGVDIDFKTTPQGTAERKLKTFCFQPTMIVFSGNGWHLYWFLTVPVLRDESTQAFFEQAGKTIARQLGGDSTFDTTRILRVPGRVNSKWPNLPMCRILSHHGPRYDAASFERFANDGVGASTRAVKVKSAPTIPAKFETLLARNSKIKATWEGRRPDLKDQSRSGYDQSMSSQLAPRRFTPDEVGAVLRAMPSGKGVDAHPAYVNLTIAKAFTQPGARPLGQTPSDPPSDCYRDTEDFERQFPGVCVCAGEGLQVATEARVSVSDEQEAESVEGFIRWACKASRESANAHRWRDSWFHFLRLLKGRKEFSQMSRDDLEKSELWRLTDFSTEEVFNACATWPKVKTGATENRLRDALILARLKPVESCKVWAHHEPYMLFLSFIFHLQQQAGADVVVFLPCRKIAELLETDAMAVSRFRQMAVAHGFLTELEKATPRKATRFKVELAKFQAPEVVH